MTTKIKFTNAHVWSMGVYSFGVKTIPVNASSFDWIAIKCRHTEPEYEAKLYRYIHYPIKHFFMKYIQSGQVAWDQSLRNRHWTVYGR